MKLLLASIMLAPSLALAQLAETNAPAGSEAVRLGSIPTPSDKNKSSSPSSGFLQIFAPTAASNAAIAAAAAAASAVGGGIVQLPVGTIKDIDGLPMYNGVYYRGAGWGVNQQSDSSRPTGTVLVCASKSVDAFDYNNTDRITAPTNGATFQNSRLVGGGISDVTIKGCNYGIKVGALWNAGAQSFELRRIFAWDNNWGFWLENFINCNFEDLVTQGSVLGSGWFFSSGGSALNGGNSTFRRLLAQDWLGGSGSLITTRGWVFGSRGAGTTNAINALDVREIQTNRQRIKSAQTTSMSNGSTLIQVSDSTKFAIDQPVVFSATANGFIANQTYFVVGIERGSIRVANTIGSDVPIVPTGGTAINVITDGFPGLEIIGYGTNTVQPSQWHSIDMEGGGTTHVLVQNAYDCVLRMGFVESGSYFISHATFRGAINCDFTGVGLGNSGFIYDIDSNSYTTRIQGPRANANHVEANRYTGQGVSMLKASSGRQKANSSGLYMSGQAYGPELFLNGAGFVESSVYPLGSRSTSFSSGEKLGATSVQVYIGAGGGNATLPAVNQNGDGMILIICNPSDGTLTLNTSNGQTINGRSTSYSMSAYSTVVVASYGVSNVPTGWMIR